jgi:hypothetical protein
VIRKVGQDLEEEMIPKDSSNSERSVRILRTRKITQEFFAVGVIHQNLKEEENYESDSFSVNWQI